jgi:DNA-binding MarR family transcriptional regulator
MTSIEISTLSHSLKRMSHDGWITRARHAKDNRSVLASLTDQGRKLAVVLRPYIRRYNDLAVRGMPAADVAQLRNVLGRIYENVLSTQDSMPEFPDFPERKLRLAGE